MTEANPLVIVGAGHAGFQLALALRQNHYDGSIKLVNNEPYAPYQRPPLSKAYLKGDGNLAPLAFRPKAFFSEQRIELIPAKAEAIDRGKKKIRLSAGAELQYGHLVLAVGARNRELRSPHEEGCIHYIRTLAETARLKERLLSARHVTVVGAGFIGLEFASTARLKGLTVDVIELGQRLMERAVTPEISQFFLRRHERSGVNFHFGTEVAGIERGGGDGRYTIALAQGKKIETDLVVAGIGVNPNTELAASAGLVVNGGILVDQNLSTSDANISAIGDCVVFPTPYATKPVRIESVQNATDQARCLAARLVGKGAPYRSLPWFWSDQGSDKLQIVGLTHDVDRTVLRGSPETGSFSVFCYAGDRLLGIESVNRPADHVVGRKILERGGSVDPNAAADPDFVLKTLLE